MSSIRHSHLPVPQRGLGPIRGPRKWSVLPKADHLELQRHLALCDAAGEPASTLLAYVLLHKIMATEPVENFSANDLVIGDSRVIYSENGGRIQSGVLVHSTRSKSARRVVQVRSLLGATLIGMRVGQRAPLLRTDGTIGTIAVLGVAQPH